MAITPEERKVDGLGTTVGKLSTSGTGVTFGSPVAVGSANADGSSANVPHADHVHSHGDQAGGSLHSVVIAGGNAGFMSGSDKTKLDGLSGITFGSPVAVGSANADGSSANVPHADHVHSHGDQAGGSLHSVAIAGGNAGFMSGSDKTKLDGLAPGAGGAFVAPIDTLVNLAAVPAGALPDGSMTYVNEVEDIYVLEKATSHVADGVTVITATGGGYWIARNYGRWDDVQGSISQGAGAGNLTLEFYKDTRFNMYFMRHDQDDELSFVYQFTHTWDYSKVVVPHLHCVPMADPASPLNIRLDGYFVWSRAGYAAYPMPSLTGWTPFGVDVPVAPGDIDVQKIVSLGSISPPSWARESTCLLIYMRRNGTGLGDTYITSKASGGTQAANLGLLSTDVHYRIKRQGTEAELPT